MQANAPPRIRTPLTRKNGKIDNKEPRADIVADSPPSTPIMESGSDTDDPTGDGGVPC